MPNKDELCKQKLKYSKSFHQSETDNKQLQQDSQEYNAHSSHSDAETEKLFNDFDKVLVNQTQEPIETAVAEQISNNDGDGDGNGDDAGDYDGDADGRSDDDNEATSPHL